MFPLAGVRKIVFASWGIILLIKSDGEWESLEEHGVSVP